MKNADGIGGTETWAHRQMTEGEAKQQWIRLRESRWLR
jgi:hypothetical protein